MTKRALITGITGQDGSYLAEFLLKKGYEVHGMIRRVALEDQNTRMSRINHIKHKLILHPGSLESYGSILNIFDEIKLDECYHLAAQSFVHTSFEDCFSTFNTNINGTLNILSAIHRKRPKCRFYFAGSSEMFGYAEDVPQTEKTRFHPRSPYGISKETCHSITKNYRESYNIFACSGILFNHESPRRGFEFVTRKISDGVARIKMGYENVLELGYLEARRDWGFAGDYVDAMWRMLQRHEPSDYVVATGKNFSIKDFVDLSFKHADLSYEFVDLHKFSVKKADQKVRELQRNKNKVFVVQHPRWYRPAEVYSLLGDATKARTELGWHPKVSFQELVKMMVEHDVKRYNIMKNQV